MSAEGIGHFRIERLIGQGGMGSVYRALDTRLGRRVALKFLRPERASNPVLRDRMRREARALSRLNHPGICQVYELLERPEGDVLVVEWIEGASLADRLLAEGPLRIGEALRIVRDVARALAAAHAHGVVHRDLKPANVMVSLAGEVKVLDFGLARLLGPASPETDDPVLGGGAVSNERDTREAVYSDDTPLTALGRVPGTRGYIAPEARSGVSPGEKGDVFALGVTLYELIAGRLPFASSTEEPLVPFARRYHPLSDSVPALRAPRALEGLLARMLDESPERRPTAAEAAEDCERLLAAPARRRKRALAGAAIGVVAVLVAALLAATRPAVRGLAKGRPAAIAVLPMRNGTGEARWDALVGAALPDLVARALRVDAKLSVVSSASLDSAARQLGFGTAAFADEPARRTARLSGARLYVTGSLVKAGAGRVALDVALRGARGEPLAARRLQARADVPFVQPLAAEAAELVLRAVDPLGTARGAARPLEPIPERVLSQYAEALQSWRRGDNKAAFAAARRVAQSAPGFAPAATLAATVAGELALYDVEEDEAAWAAGLAHAAGDVEAEVEARERLADAAGRKGDAALELERRKAAEAAARASEDPIVLARIHDALGKHWFRVGEPRRMEPEERAAVEIARRLGRRDLEARWLGRLGLALGFTGRRAESIALHRRSAALARELGDVPVEATALTNMAGMELEEGDLAGAERGFLGARAIFAANGNREGLSNCELNLGEIALRRGALAEAAARYRSALAITSETGDAAGREYALHELGLVLALSGDLTGAEKEARAALASAAASQSLTTKNNALLVLGEVAERRGDGRGALARRREALAAVRSAPGAAPFELAQAASAVARSLLLEKPPSLDEVRALLAEAEATGESTVDVLLEKGRLLALSGEREKAKATLRAAEADAARRQPRRLDEIRRVLSAL